MTKAYTNEHFVRLMRTGEVAAGGESTTGMMSGIARARFAVLTDAEIAALKRYLDPRWPQPADAAVQCAGSTGTHA